ncbi:MAG: site-2 protease family protein [Deltaproteobacteria bacterium]
MRLQIVLFLATFFTTLVAGAFLAGGNPIARPHDLALGLMFAVPLLSILGVHEMGHYTAARRNRVEVTPPYFIPAPPVGLSIGTFGAFIKIRSPLPHRDALLEIGAAGPIAGALVAIPVLFLGMAMSEVREVLPAAGGFQVRLGEPLLLKAATYLLFGAIPEGQDVVLHPVAFAGWIGLFVTALNLIPSGQLDGGHIAYALFGGRYERVARLVPVALLPLGLLWPGWLLWAGLLLVLGTRHPRPVFDEIPLSPGHRKIGAVAALLFLLCFTPAPFTVVG